MLWLYRKLSDWWNTFQYGPPCESHPGHRVHEVDVESAGIGLFCSECWEEYRLKYGIE
jgi:hypothetical protein